MYTVDMAVCACLDFVYIVAANLVGKHMGVSTCVQMDVDRLLPLSLRTRLLLRRVHASSVSSFS